MKLGILFSGGKDSALAAVKAKEHGHEIACLLSVFSSNPVSYMFHTPAIEKTRQQAERMQLPLHVVETKGEKESELEDLKQVIKEGKEQFGIEGVVTGAVESVYQATRIQRICHELDLHCFNPLWQKPQLALLQELVEKKFDVILTGIAAYPLDKTWIGRRINQSFIDEMNVMADKFEINPAGEGGEFESLVLDCPLFSQPLKVVKEEAVGRENNWLLEVELE
jgi:diphthine-ammonia ligase